ncbi:MAG: nucleoside hydrolase, partial [bacterium]
MKKIPIILDTDIGTDIDDSWALAMLLKSPEFDVKLVVSDTHNTEYRAKLIAKFLEVADRTDIPVGVGIKLDDVYESCSRYAQYDWVKDYSLKDYPGIVYE